ncbi:D-alanyl-D-alanine carboxypeptidase family protein [Oceanobacillus massiliensis]|uniref:D-alanyl-D-alanine carboxypeptidase family protein n=1 Tax=Oceanobacillus massiliensis TaxID=1465765 RepID=UPI000288323F|nr:D-alanyl-D-alanine carboxypeptidase family protein [Oceanobacillus massiliensis]
MNKKTLTITLLILTISGILAACSGIDQTFDQSDQKPEGTPSSTEQPGEKELDPDEKDLTVPEGALQKKDEGDQVKLLQSALNTIGYSVHENGLFDETTTWAITDFQLQQDSLLVSGIYDEPTKKALKKTIEANETITAGAGLPQQAEPAVTDAGTEVIANPYDQIALINKEHALPADYIPEDLVIPDVPFPFAEDLPKKQMREAAAKSLEQLFNKADEAGLELYAQSGYRSYERQDAIFASNVLKHGEEEANTFSARPGESEHQSGLTMDITSPNVNFDLITEFGETEEGKWIQENAAEFGFIIRFPEGKEEITKYQYEPWHLRFVGKKAAKEIMSQGITLEEYLN